MSTNRELRLDPLYRVINEPDELCIIEGTFKILFDRLKNISNLGIIPEVFEMAKYPKYEHSLGVVHQVRSLLDVADENVIPNEYRKPLILASILLHLGHLPYTYSTERALLLAGNLGSDRDNPVRELLARRLNKVLDVTDFNDEKKRSILKNILSMRDYRHLYRYFSAEIAIDRWDSISNKIDDLDREDLRIVVEDLIDPESDGHDRLNLADRADYVQRDALYFGTVKIDIAPKHLYAQLSKDRRYLSMSEEKLIDYNLNYLNERFYDAPKVICFTRLYEKILAALIVHPKFKLEWLDKYADEELKRLVCKNLDIDNTKTYLTESWIERASSLFCEPITFKRVFKLPGIYFKKEKDAVDIEYELIDKNKSLRGLLSYPFERGVLLSIDYGAREHYFPRPDVEPFSVTVFRDDTHQSILPLLQVVNKLSVYISVINHSHELRVGLGEALSWTDSVRFDNQAIVEEIANAIFSIEENNQNNLVMNFMRDIRGIKTFARLWDNWENEFFWRPYVMASTNDQTDSRQRELFVEGILGLPVRLLQYISTKSYLDRIYEQMLISLSSDLPNDRKGNIFEALWLINKLRQREGSFQFFLNGMIVTDPQKPPREQDDNEFDVIELSISEEGNAECWVYACSISDAYENNNKEQLTKLVDYLRRTYPEMTTETRYVIPTNKQTNNWSPKMQHTGRNYNP